MIKRVKWKNHYSLGNFELDFTKADGSAYNTVILAGENGTGKTTILETLSSFLNGQSIGPFDFMEYEAAGADYRIIPDTVNWMVGFHKRALVGTENYERIDVVTSNNEERLRQDTKDIRYYGFSYSKARSGFNTNRVTSVTTEQVDSEKFEPDQSDDFTRIKQLIIDIEQQDDAAWREETSHGSISDQKYNEFINERSKAHRFAKAFNDFFENVKYNGIDSNDTHEKTVRFKKYDKIIPIDQLSTGEKQIVFRGAHLLRNMNSIAGGTVLIDEPELSMHPAWQERILNYYRGLFTNNNTQSVQMIVATHSEYVLRSALEDRDHVLVISLHDNNGIIEANRITAPHVLPSLTAAEINYLVFGIITIDYHIELYGYLQSKELKNTVKECDDFIAASALYNPLDHEKMNSYGHTTYQTLPTFIRNAIDHPDSGRQYTYDELKKSIELLIDLCR